MDGARVALRPEKAQSKRTKAPCGPHPLVLSQRRSKPSPAKASLNAQHRQKKKKRQKKKSRCSLSLFNVGLGHLVSEQNKKRTSPPRCRSWLSRNK
eukprot:3910042-Rhodomonas_salina.2